MTVFEPIVVIFCISEWLKFMLTKNVIAQFSGGIEKSSLAFGLPLENVPFSVSRSLRSGTSFALNIFSYG